MKTIIITGASRGIGLATAQKFLNEGWTVIGTYLNNPIPLQAPNLIAVKLDQGSADSIKNAVAEIKKLNLKTDALVNNAAILLDVNDNFADLAKIKKTFDVDLFGLIDLTEQLVAIMNTGSHIVNIDSGLGAFSYPIDDDTTVAYRMAKAALNMYTRSLAFRLKNQGILVSSIDPGWVKTDMGKAAGTETEGPNREPEQPAGDIYKLVTTVTDLTESGFFWKDGKKREW